MASTFTPNIQLEEPARGDDVGTWDTPVNNNMTLLDLIAGGSVTISGAAGSVVLGSAQFRAKGITITFPTSFTKSYEVFNTCTGSSAYTITLQTTAAGGQVICCPPGQTVDVINDGTNLRFKNLGGPIGSYWDYAGSSNPAWNTGCTVPPYLPCDGSTFSATTYPQLAVMLGSTTLPNSKGRYRLTLDQGAGNISSATGLSSVGTMGGSQTIGSSNLPASIPYKDTGHVHLYNQASFPGGGSVVPAGVGGPQLNTISTNTGNATIGITINPSTAAAGTGNAFLPPSYVSGLTLLRAG